MSCGLKSCHFGTNIPEVSLRFSNIAELNKLLDSSDANDTYINITSQSQPNAETLLHSVIV